MPFNNFYGVKIPITCHRALIIMIEKIIDLGNKAINLDTLSSFRLSELHQIKEELQILSNVTPTFYEKDGFESIWNLINIEIAEQERPKGQKNAQNREKVFDLIKSKKVSVFRKVKKVDSRF